MTDNMVLLDHKKPIFNKKRRMSDIDIDGATPAKRKCIETSAITDYSQPQRFSDIILTSVCGREFYFFKRELDKCSKFSHFFDDMEHNNIDVNLPTDLDAKTLNLFLNALDGNTIDSEITEDIWYSIFDGFRKNGCDMTDVNERIVQMIIIREIKDVDSCEVFEFLKHLKYDNVDIFNKHIGQLCATYLENATIRNLKFVVDHCIDGINNSFDKQWRFDTIKTMFNRIIKKSNIDDFIDIVLFMTDFKDFKMHHELNNLVYGAILRKSYDNWPELIRKTASDPKKDFIYKHIDKNIIDLKHCARYRCITHDELKSMILEVDSDVNEIILKIVIANREALVKIASAPSSLGISIDRPLPPKKIMFPLYRM